jgi:hypothetical protein
MTFRSFHHQLQPLPPMSSAAMESSSSNRNENALSIPTFLRLRPLDPFESARRSRSAVWQDDNDHKRIVVEDPERGEWEAELDGVRDSEWGACLVCVCVLACFGTTRLVFTRFIHFVATPFA